MVSKVNKVTLLVFITVGLLAMMATANDGNMLIFL